MVKYRPRWYYGNIVASPAAGTALVSFTVPKGYVGYIFGFSLSLKRQLWEPVLHKLDVKRGWQVVLHSCPWAWNRLL